MTAAAPTPIICDANVLIDYFEADKRILTLVVRHAGPILVPSSVLDEVDQIDVEEAGRLGLMIIEPEDIHVIQSGTQGGPLSRNDKLIIAIAKDKRYICWTNDSHLRKRCENNGIHVYWGLEMMLRLCQMRCLSKHTAIRTARKIQKNNSAFVSPDIIDQFEFKVKELFKTRR